MDFLHHFNKRELLIGAFRYYLGRKTASAFFFADSLAKSWPDLSRGIQAIIKSELEEAFTLDDNARAEGRKDRYLGDDGDRAMWEKVRSNWREKA